MMLQLLELHSAIYTGSWKRESDNGITKGIYFRNLRFAPVMPGKGTSADETGVTSFLFASNSIIDSVDKRKLTSQLLEFHSMLCTEKKIALQIHRKYFFHFVLNLYLGNLESFKNLVMLYNYLWFVKGSIFSLWPSDCCTQILLREPHWPAITKLCFFRQLKLLRTDRFGGHRFRFFFKCSLNNSMDENILYIFQKFVAIDMFCFRNIKPYYLTM